MGGDPIIQEYQEKLHSLFLIAFNLLWAIKVEEELDDHWTFVPVWLSQ
jgi:hypothetical protein